MFAFKETEYFNIDFVHIMNDLLNYKYSIITTPALMLLNNYYTAFESIFRKCVQAKVGA